MSGRLKRPSPAMVVAISALVLALVGGAYAATKIGPKKIKPNAIRTSKIKDEAVTTPKLAIGERSEGFVRRVTATQALAPATDNNVVQMTLPEGGFMLTGTVELGSSAGASRSIQCRLLDANNPVAAGGAFTPALAVFSDTISLTGVSDGGVVGLTCNPDGSANARNASLTAVRLASVTELTQ